MRDLHPTCAKTPPCTGAIHRQPAANTPRHSKAPHSAHSSNALNAAANPALKPRPLTQPKPQVRHPGQTRHGPPIRPAPPLTRPGKTPETSCASKTHQNLIHNPQRTPRRTSRHRQPTRPRPQAPNPAQRQWSSPQGPNLTLSP
jgi:hypothetical protein